MVASSKKLFTDSEHSTDPRPLIWNRNKQNWTDRSQVQESFQLIAESEMPENVALVNEELKSILMPTLKGLAPALVRAGTSLKESFSWDVVYSLESLAKGFGLKYNKDDRDLLQASIEERLGVFVGSLFDRSPFRYYTIWNARKQEFQLVYGVQNVDLVRCMDGTSAAHVAATAHLRNAFSMCRSDGSPAETVDFHLFRQAFTPEFYPRRYALKDSLYEQRLDVLAQLLSFVLQRYASCRPMVGYVEFSFGVSDIARPHVLDVLAYSEPPSKFGALLDKKFFPWIKREPRVTYKFLAGFSRERLNLNWKENLLTYS